MIKVADLGHAAKKTELHVAWSRRVQDEFYALGEIPSDPIRSDPTPSRPVPSKEAGLAISHDLP